MFDKKELELIKESLEHFADFCKDSYDIYESDQEYDDIQEKINKLIEKVEQVI